MNIVVVPCYNEAARLDTEQFIGLVERDDSLSLLFVDDGSSDATATLLESLAQHPRISAIYLPANGGKAEAVRQGLVAAINQEAEWVGYVDADLATPPAEIERLIDIAQQSPDRDCVFGSRIRLCGNDVTRHLSRHLAGRVFATLADEFVLGAHVYDTQAGAKFFRNTPQLRHCLSSPFADRWSFDVELFGRLGRVGAFPQRAIEIPMRIWIDREGSKVSVLAGVRSMWSLAKVRRRIRRFPAAF